MSLVAGAMVAASIAVATICAAVGIQTAGIGAVLPPGALGSLAAFVLAIVARLRRERWSLLLLPVGVFPATVLFLALGEAFLWE